MNSHTIALFHGFGVNAQSFDLLKAELMKKWCEAKGHVYVAHEFAGHGAKHEDDIGARPIDMAIEAAVQNFRQCRNMTIVGHSMGGMIGLRVGAILEGMNPGTVKRFVSIEGTMHESDLGAVARGFRDAADVSALANIKQGLMRDCAASEHVGMRNWGQALKRVKLDTLQAYAGPLIKLAESGVLIDEFRALQDSGVACDYIASTGKTGHSAFEAIGMRDEQLIHDAGHFVHEDQPEAVATRILGMPQ